MVLEATVIIVDNSDWMRNGDYIPSRLEAQQDAVNLICAAKTQSNPESTVAVMTMSQAKNGARAEVLVTLTQDLGKILSSLASLKIGGEIDFSAALQVAQLVLKHRQNKNQHQRIVSFVGSPIKETGEDLVKLGKKLKKNNIAVDIVNFGEEQENVEKLESFIKAVNTGDESHLITVPAGPHILSDILLSSPIIVGEGGGGGFGAAAAASAAAAAAAAASGAGAAGGEYDFGVDPNLDPELAMVLRISMEEERARQEEAKRKAEQDGGAAPGAPAATTATPAAPAAAPAGGDTEMVNADDDDELQAALAMSMRESQAAAGGAQPAASSSMDLSEDDQELALAMQLSQGGAASAPTTTTPKASTSAPATTSGSSDQDFLNSVLSSLPGVDPNDARIQDVLRSLGGGEKKDEKKDDKK